MSPPLFRSLCEALLHYGLSRCPHAARSRTCGDPMVDGET